MSNHAECVLFLTKDEAMEVLQRCMGSHELDGPEIRSAMLKLASVVETCRKSREEAAHAQARAS